MQTQTLWVGIDWGTEAHQVCGVDADGHKQFEEVVKQTGEGIVAFCDRLLERVAGRVEALTVAIEAPHGAIVEALIERGIAAYAINPKQLDRFRDRYTVAGAKDDRLDAFVLADPLRTDRHCFRPLAPSHPVVVELREWSRMAEDLQQERNRLANRRREQLWRHYPQAIG